MPTKRQLSKSPQLMTQALNEFVEARPSVNLSEFAREVRVSRQMIGYIKNGSNKPSPPLLRRMIIVMERYGFKFM